MKEFAPISDDFDPTTDEKAPGVEEALEASRVLTGFYAEMQTAPFPILGAAYIMAYRKSKELWQNPDPAITEVEIQAADEVKSKLSDMLSWRLRQERQPTEGHMVVRAINKIIDEHDEKHKIR